MRLDRDRAPVLFTVVTSVLSGLILAGIMKALQSGISASDTVIWFAATAGGVAVATWAVFAVVHRFRKRSSRAFVMTSAFTQKYYLTALVHRLHSALDRDAIDMVLKVPERDYDASAQAHHLRRILARKHDYIGGIIVGGEMRRLRDDLSAFCRDSRLPIVFSDVEPFEKESEYPDNATYIGYDTGAVGALAGKWLVRHLRGKTRPHVLIVASCEHESRQQRCAEALRAAFPDVLITIDDQCDFVRAKACDAVRTHVRHLDPGQCVDGIFCTNDEMALGAVDALSVPASATRATIVVGVDGVHEVKALIDTGDSPLRATVVHDTHRLATGAVDLLVKMHRGDPVPPRTILNAEVYEAVPATHGVTA